MIRMESNQDKNFPNNTDIIQEPADESIGGRLEKIAENERAIADLEELQLASRDRRSKATVAGPIDRDTMTAQQVEEDLLDTQINQLKAENESLIAASDAEVGVEPVKAGTKSLADRAMAFFGVRGPKS